MQDGLVENDEIQYNLDNNIAQFNINYEEINLYSFNFSPF